MDATTVAVDLAKTVFELALANAQWRDLAPAPESRSVRALSRAESPDTYRHGGLRDGALLGARCAAAREGWQSYRQQRHQH
jgi:hypothetical protein